MKRPHLPVVRISRKHAPRTATDIDVRAAMRTLHRTYLYGEGHLCTVARTRNHKLLPHVNPANDSAIKTKATKRSRRTLGVGGEGAKKQRRVHRNFLIPPFHVRLVSFPVFPFFPTFF